MHNLFLVICIFAFATTASAQWIKQAVNTTASFRGLSVVNEKVVWASATGGTVIRTVDGGNSWTVMAVPGAEKLDFRDIEAFDANTAYILSIGNGDASRIYKTTDGGKTWQLQFTNKDEKAFYDAIACWDRNNCIAMGDPVGEFYQLIVTKDGGKSWTFTGQDKMPRAASGEAAFAASGTCLIVDGDSTAYLITGGTNARVFRSYNKGLSWFAVETPMAKGSAGSGIFSIAMRDGKRGIIVGGNYEKPGGTAGTAALTNDGGRTWKALTGLSGYRSGVVWVDSKTIVAVGTNGSDISYDRGSTWKKLGSEDLNAVQTDRRKTAWAVGPKGMIARIFLGSITLD